MPRKKVDQNPVAQTLEDMAQRYVNAKEEVKKFNDDIKLGDEIKKIMLAQGKLSFGVENIELTITQVQKDTTDQDKAIEILEKVLDKKYLKECVKTVKVLDEEAVKNLIYQNIIPADILQEAVVHSSSSRLNYKIMKR